MLFKFTIFGTQMEQQRSKRCVCIAMPCIEVKCKRTFLIQEHVSCKCFLIYLLYSVLFWSIYEYNMCKGLFLSSVSRSFYHLLTPFFITNRRRIHLLFVCIRRFSFVEVYCLHSLYRSLSFCSKHRNRFQVCFPLCFWYATWWFFFLSFSSFCSSPAFLI